MGVREYSGTQLSGNILISSAKYNYEDKTNRLSSIVRNSLLGTQEIGYVYGNTLEGQNPDAVYTVKQNGIPLLNYTYDPLGRLSGRTLSAINKTQEYSYAQGGYGESSTTTLVSSVTQNGITTGYTYDANGNITEIKENGVVKESYTYDSLNQLKTVTRNNITTGYEYDNNGNILSVTQKPANNEETAPTTVKSYAYGDSEWKDLLTGFNGQSISYDVIGNPLNYRGKTMTWERGRRLAGITEGDNAIAYTYDDSGLRLSKTVNGQKTTYYVLNGELLGQQNPNGGTLQFLFDESGAKYGFIYNGAAYYYNLNLQGDVIGIFDSTGTDVVQYAYDEWGKILSVTGTLASTIGQINPIRYRGYYYDSETGFYYLQSRYYDPETGRFINADATTDGGAGVLGNNLYIYAANNPINNLDPTGHWIIKNAIKWLSKKVVKPVVKKVKKELSKINLTYTKGLSASGSPGIWNFNAQGGISIDAKGNVAFQGTFVGGATTNGTLSGAVGNFSMITNAPTVNELNGSGYQIGASASIPIPPSPIAISVGRDVNIIPNSKLNTNYYGLSSFTGIAPPYPSTELHFEWGETGSAFLQFNVFNVMQNIYIRIMEW